MQKLINKLFDIREGEGLRAFMMFSYIFLIIASLLIVKPVRNSLFLTKFGVSQLPYAFILVALSATAFTKIYSIYAKKIRLNRLIWYTTLICITSLVFFLLMLYLNYRGGWFFYVFYVWVALFGVITTSQFWLLANYVFNAREAKRLFGLVGAGAISGGIFGGYLTKFLAPIIGTDNMILFCIGFLLICSRILIIVWKTSARYNYAEKLQQEKRITKKIYSDNPFKIIIKSRHLTYLAGIVGVGVVVANMVDFQFSAIATEVIKNENQLTAFFGFWLSNLSIASLFVQLFLTSRVLKLFGVSTSLFFLPISVLIGAVSILIYPALISAILIKVSDGSFKQSVNKAGLELLALPIPGNIKNQAKAFIDVFVDSLATGMGGVLLIIFANYVGLSVQYISLIIIGLIGLWIYLILRVRQEYINSFRLAIEKRTIDLEDQTVNIQDASVFESLMQVLSGSNERQILYVLKLIENVNNEKFLPLLMDLIHHPSGEIKIQALKLVEHYDADFTEQAHNLIKDEDFDVKVSAIRYLHHHASDGEVLISKLLSHSDYKIRTAAFLCAAMENRDNTDFRGRIDFKALFDQFVDQLYRIDYSQDEIQFMKVNLAKVIGRAGEPQLFPFLHNLLNDHEIKVVRSAITGAGMTRDANFIPTLVEHLNINAVRNQARAALIEYEDEVIEILANHLNDFSETRKVRLEIPKALALINSQKSVNALIRNLEQNDLQLRYGVLKALNKLKNKFPNLKFDRQKIRSYIIHETKYYYQILNLFHQHNKFCEQNNNDCNRIKAARQLLVKALEEKLDFNLEIIFRLLGLRYPLEDIYNSYLGIISKKSDLRANAVEFLDNILDANLKRLIIPIIEENSINVLVHKTQQYFGFELPTEEESIRFLLQGEDNWLKVCTLFFIAQTKNDKFKDIIAPLVNDSDPYVKETAEYYFKNIAS